MEIFWEVHRGLPREAPGDPASTEKAYSLITELPTAARLLDVGCGPGTSTFQLAQLSNGQVYAIDLHTPFLEEVARQAKQTDLGERVSAVQMSMNAMGFSDESFDLIWSEGAIYIGGFENGLRDWRRLLRLGGYLAVTEATWLKDTRPEEIEDFWSEAYPQMAGIQANIEKIGRQGYRLVEQFTLPETAWWEGYYGPMQERIDQLRLKYLDNSDAQSQLNAEEEEIEMYRRYSACYGYVFYVAQKL
jgi:ubiquinone/menaquinone biosynthesis C-methylase UbiE